ncbi:MAG: hypothetical protein HY257_10200 [Chloroflexi bacterium]|nr:hypothetical protein [Chloroflexota bacterium]
MNRLTELLQRRMWIGPLSGLIVGLALGLLIGWVIAPVSYQLSADDVQLIADSYSVSKDAELAGKRIASLSKDEQTRLLTKLISDKSKSQPADAARLIELAQKLDISVRATPGAATTSVASATRVPTPSTSSTSTSSSTSSLAGLFPLLAIIAVAAAILIAGIILVPRVLPELRARRAKGAPTNAAAKTMLAPAAQTNAPARPGGLGRYVAAYTLGNDNYDTSFSLETPRQEFLGECGMGISETIGEGKPAKVTAFDVWLFDKGDVRTVTQILMSEYAYNDPTMRGKLASKGDAVLAEKGKTLHLETQSLKVDAQIVELVYAQNANHPANSHFQKLTVEMIPTMKTNGSG